MNHYIGMDVDDDSPDLLVPSFRRMWGSKGRGNIPSKGFKGVEYDFRDPTADAVIDYPAFGRYPLSRSQSGVASSKYCIR